MEIGNAGQSLRMSSTGNVSIEAQGRVGRPRANRRRIYLIARNHALKKAPVNRAAGATIFVFRSNQELDLYQLLRRPKANRPDMPRPSSKNDAGKGTAAEDSSTVPPS